MNHSIMNDAIIRYLQKNYTDNLLSVDGVTYPILTYPVEPERSIDDLMGMLSESYEDEFAIYDEQHLHQIQMTRSITNGMCYIFDSLELNPPRINARLGHYFDMLATCDAIDHELRTKPAHTPLRNQLHQAISPQNALIYGAKRSGTIGGAVLTVFNAGDTYRAIIVQRSNQVATGAGQLHIMPAFIVQPSHDIQAEWTLRYHIIREYGEELFAMPEYHEWPTPIESIDYFRENPHIIELETMLADGRAGLYPTGIVMNLMSLRCEFCSVLVIHDPEWHTRNESALKLAQQTERQATYYPPIDDLDQLPNDWRYHIEPQGMGALYLGQKVLKNILI